MTNFLYAYYKNREPVKETDEWDHAIYTTWCKPYGGIIDFKITSKRDLADFNKILEQVYMAGEDNARSKIREALGL